jgi:hypothetical protein
VKCGERGHLTVEGLPCGQEIAEHAAGCVWHVSSPEQRSELASRGQLEGQRRRKRALPASTAYPVLSDPEGCRKVLSDTIQSVRTGCLHPQLGSVVIAGVRVAIELATLEVAAQVGDLERRFRLRKA